MLTLAVIVTLNHRLTQPVIPISWDVDVRYIEIQDGSQLTGNSNISETVTYIIKIPTAKLRHSALDHAKLA